MMMMKSTIERSLNSPLSALAAITGLFLLISCMTTTTTSHVVDAASSDQVEIVSCYLYPSEISDLGWTFQMNQARTVAATAVFNRYPDVKITSRYVENFATANSPTEREALIRNTLVKSTADGGWGCNSILSLSVVLFRGMTTQYDDFAREFPSIQWYHFSGPDAVTSGWPSNMRFMGVDIWASWFLAGAAAGRHLKDGGKICMFYPFGGQNAGINAFYRGMQFVESSADFHVAQILTFNNAALEKQCAIEFVKRGCQIVVRWADSRDSDLYVAGLTNNNTYPVYSIGYAADTAKYVGDSVLTSVFHSMNEFFENVYLAQINSTAFTYPEGLQGLDTGAIELADITDRVSNEVRLAANQAKAWILANRSKLFCEDAFRTLINGTVATGSGADGCLSNADIVLNTWSTHANINRFSRILPVTTCIAGEYAEYDEATIALSCLPCPENTFSSEPGSTVCTPCPEGRVSAMNSTSCELIIVQEGGEGFPAWAIALIVVLSIVLIVLVIVVVIAFLRPREMVYEPGAAPQGPEVTLVIIALDLKHNNKWRQNFLPVVDIMSELVLRAASETQGYIVSSVGEVHLLAFNSPDIALHFLELVKHQAAARKFPVSVSLRASIHHGTPRIVKRKNPSSGFEDSNSSSKKEDKSVRRVRFVGRDLEVVREMFRASADQGGGIWCSTSAVARYPPQDAVFGSETTVQTMDGKKESILQLESYAYTGNQIVDFTKLTFSADPETGGSSSGSREEMDNQSAKVSVKSGDTAGTEEMDETNDLALATLAMISPQEFEAAHEFTAEILRSFIGLLPYKDSVSVLTTTSRKLRLREPNVPSDLPRKELGMRILRQPVSNVATQLLRQLEELELVMFMDRWHQASQNREEAVRAGEDEKPNHQAGSTNGNNSRSGLLSSNSIVPGGAASGAENPLLAGRGVGTSNGDHARKLNNAVTAAVAEPENTSPAPLIDGTSTGQTYH